jgi:hypothetical protein
MWYFGPCSRALNRSGKGLIPQYLHNINTRRKLQLHKPATKLTDYQRSVYCNSINIYSKLPDNLTKLVSNKKCFLQELKNKYLIAKPFYSVEEYLNALHTYDGRHNVEMFV